MERLKKELTLLHVFCIASGAMISSALFVLPGEAYSFTGQSPALVISYLLGAILASASMLSIAEIATAMPKAGGDYFFISRTLGPAVGSISGLLSWFALSMKSAFALVGMAAFVRLFPQLVNTPIAVAGGVFCLLFMLLNIVGVRAAARTQVLLVAALFVLMVVYLIAGLPKVNLEHFEPFAPGGLTPVLAGVGFIFVGYGGLLKVVSVGEELKDPVRTIPRGLLLSLGVVGLFYVVMVFVTLGLLPADELAGNLTPISDGAAKVLGRPGFYLLGLAAIFAFFSTANAGIASASRYLFALSRDELIPPVFSKLSERFRTPVVSIIATGIFITIVLLLPLGILVRAASTVIVLTCILACLAHIIFREGKLQNYRPGFTAPLYPYLQIAGIFGYVATIYFLGFPALVVCLIMGVVGFVIYRFYGSRKSGKEYALMHIVARLTTGGLVGRTLESELRDIIRERDEFEKDRFDLLVESCPIFDIEEEISSDELFDRVADIFGERLGVDREEISRKLIGREREGTTALSQDFAVPHATIDGEGKYEMVVVRASRGIRFSDECPRVHVVFILVGTRDERHFHLRSLAAIAQIIQGADFDRLWKEARNEDDVRDILLMSSRFRHDSGA